MRTIAIIAASLGFALTLSAPADAAPIPSTSAIVSRDVAADIHTVSGGCGPFAWRGPWGHSRDTPYSGPLPGGGFAGGPGPDFFGNGCPPGYWHGPWGHCRDTPFHGRRPDGTWQ